MFKEEVQDLLQQALSERESLFLIDLSIDAHNAVKIVLDGDHGVTVKDCSDISRAIANGLDPEEIDFSLEVTSAGATSPIIKSRQYKKNIGRKLEIKTRENTFTGNLTAATDNSIILEWKAREPKPIGKGKVTVQKKQEIALSEIEEAKVVLKF